MESHLLQMRGLKLQTRSIRLSRLVASFTDAWIETGQGGEKRPYPNVASFTDAWIETDRDKSLQLAELSHLLQMRGLKLLYQRKELIITSRIFYRCVD